MIGTFPAPATPASLSDIARAMLHPSFELDANEAAIVVSMFMRARANGYIPDDFTVALVEVLKRQLMHGDEDGDHDEADELLDLEDGDEDNDDEREPENLWPVPAHIACPIINTDHVEIGGRL
jgi:hypothetical protein